MKEIKLNEVEIKAIALNKFFDNQYKSVYDIFVLALESWLIKNDYIIIKRPPEQREELPEGQN